VAWAATLAAAVRERPELGVLSSGQRPPTFLWPSHVLAPRLVMTHVVIPDITWRSSPWPAAIRTTCLLTTRPNVSQRFSTVSGGFTLARPGDGLSLWLGSGECPKHTAPESVGEDRQVRSLTWCDVGGPSCTWKIIPRISRCRRSTSLEERSGFKRASAGLVTCRCAAQLSRE